MFHDLEKSVIVKLHFYTGKEPESVVHVVMHLNNVLQSDLAHESVRCGTEIGS